MLRHGIYREVFICLMVNNAMNLLRTGKGQPDLSTLIGAREVAQKAVERWMLARSKRRPEYRNWTIDNLIDLFGNQRRVIESQIPKVS